MNLRKHYEKKSGYRALFSARDGISKYIDFGILSLEPGETFDDQQAKKESGLVILSGKISLKIGNKKFGQIGNRTSVFAGRAYGAYIPLNAQYSVQAEETAEIAVFKVPCEKVMEPYIVSPEENVRHVVGHDNWTRDVYDIIGLDQKAQRMVVGETVNLPGNWSSYPPHRHENHNPPEESKQEEVYFFKVDPGQGFGFQRIYTEDREIDETYAIVNNDCVFIPRGYHPVGSAGGYHLYYLWILCGEDRVLIPRDDPDHSWIKKR